MLSGRYLCFLTFWFLKISVVNKFLTMCLALVTGDPDALVKVAGRKESALEGWADNEHLQLLNLTYVF